MNKPVEWGSPLQGTVDKLNELAGIKKFDLEDYKTKFNTIKEAEEYFDKELKDKFDTFGEWAEVAVISIREVEEDERDILEASRGQY